MKKMLLTLTTVGVLAVPAGMAFAQTGTDEPAEPVPTCVEPVRDRDRDRSIDKAASGDQVQLQLRTQQREQLQLDDGTCDADCTGDQTRMRDRSSIADGSGSGAEFRLGETGKAATRHGNSYGNS